MCKFNLRGSREVRALPKRCHADRALALPETTITLLGRTAAKSCFHVAGRNLSSSYLPLGVNSHGGHRGFYLLGSDKCEMTAER